MTIKRKSNRLPGYDYSAQGAYFVTINTRERGQVFGFIINGEMKLNKYGIIVDQQWKWIFKQYNYIESDEYVIMPDHFHGILHIVVRNGRDRSLRKTKIKPLPELIGAFKTTSSKLIHQAGNNKFKWQKSYYDRIIRDEGELNLIREYIINNHLKPAPAVGL